MLGGFHIAKCILHCIGKFIKGIRLDDISIKTRVFGAKVLEAFLAGTHYVRSFRRMFTVPLLFLP